MGSANFTYLAIWYTNGAQVWVANRDIPIIGNGVLMIDDLGTLKVINGSGNTLFNVYYNQVGKVNKTRAVLEDSGNFVVYDDTTNNNNRILWQSFDHPTDTLITGMKIGYNLTTKQNWTLTSSLSHQVPASGSFTMRLEQYQNSIQLVIYQHGELYWVSGPWNSTSGTFQFMLWVYLYKYPYNVISDPSGTYLIIEDIGYSKSTLQLSFNGEFSNGIRDFCYTNDTSGCAVYTALPKCRDPFVDYWWDSVYLTGGYDISKDDNSSIGFADCRERCWKDCNCTGFFSFHSNGTGCITSSGGNIVYKDNINRYVLRGLNYNFDKIFKTWMWILVSLASVVAASLCFVMIRRRILKGKDKKKRDDFIHQLTGSDSFNYGDDLEKDIKDAPDVKIFSFKAILNATNNFSNENKLGQGGYGPVYKGKLFDGREIAVKRLSKTSGQGILEFKSELILISKLQHTNLVRLYGCCIHQEEKMLIYEFMSNKSMDFFLFGEDKKEKLNWQTRFNIIEGVAQGLLYLHKYSRMKIIHRDLKVSNVLLDGNMNPKIADFGMARIFKQDETEAVTNRVVGTYGYMAPEYAMEGTFSFKTDVFSFGVLILEIVSGKRNSSFYNIDRPLNLVGYVWELWNGQAALEVKDKALGESFHVKQLLRAIHVGLLCVQEYANDRPTMLEVIYMLNNEITDLSSPKPPAFFTESKIGETRPNDYLLDINVPVSKNSLTITMEAR